ncbi:hypothetical protein [Nocardioides albus]|uniref:Uncharacterized protein n=1 Tax=Nocardioides albus TaxID=1841 RepID=A0A7W5A8T6_9ACTN|nr:hypothetical protein [Nocardioides albus]MBB3091731.1 hypothetical protein [Nocardioides albus]GGU32276.1 hypothetical protein GCM10007979_34220 [Nocardioides albus]
MSDPQFDLSTALRDRVADEHPDVVRLTADAIAEGSRLRRRRHVVVTAGAAAAVGAFVAGGLGLSQLLATTAVDEASLGAASAPSTSASASAGALATGQTVDLGNGLTGLVVTNAEADTMDITIQGASMLTGPGTGFTMIVSGPEQAVQDYWSAGFPIGQDYPGLRFATEGLRQGLVDSVPVEVPAGWTCEWFLIDDKASCTSDDGGVAGLVIRPAKDYKVWSTSPDKGGPGSGAYVTDLHGDIFISVQSGQGTTDADLEKLATSLTWVS